MHNLMAPAAANPHYTALQNSPFAPLVGFAVVFLVVVFVAMIIGAILKALTR